MRVDGYKYIFCGKINQIDCWDQLVLVAAIFLAEGCQGTTGVRFPGAQARVAVPGRQFEASVSALPPAFKIQ